MRKPLALFITVAMAGLVFSPAQADKLIVFKNGKALKAKSVVKDGIWLKCEFENKNFVSVKASTVESIEEAVLGSKEGDYRPNKVAAGSGYVAPPASFAPDPQAEVQQEAQQQQQIDQEDAAAAIAEEQQALRDAALGMNNGTVVGNPRGGRRGLAASQQQQQGVQQSPNGLQGFQPLNQPNPFPNRRGLAQRDAARRNRFGANPNGQQQN